MYERHNIPPRRYIMREPVENKHLPIGVILPVASFCSVLILAALIYLSYQ